MLLGFAAEYLFRVEDGVMPHNLPASDSDRNSVFGEVLKLEPELFLIGTA